MFCALLMSRYQVSVYRTNGPLVSIRLRAKSNINIVQKINKLLSLFDKYINYISYVLRKRKSPFCIAGQIKNFFTPERILNQKIDF